MSIIIVFYWILQSSLDVNLLTLLGLVLILLPSTVSDILLLWTWQWNVCHTRVAQQICCTTHEFHVSIWSNIIIWSSINVNDTLIKCVTRTLHIMLCVKCKCGHLKLFNYPINYSQYCLALLLSSQSKGNLSEHMLHSYLISSGAQKDFNILDDTKRWLAVFNKIV